MRMLHGGTALILAAPLVVHLFMPHPRCYQHTVGITAGRPKHLIVAAAAAAVQARLQVLLALQAAA